MINFEGKKNILWDFDGVLVDSMKIRTQGFLRVLSGYPKQEVDELLQYHIKNGGLSRYAKFGYFFKNIRKEAVSEEKVQELAQKYSQIMREKMLEGPMLIQDSITFVRENFKKFEMHVVSGSDGNELRFLCEKLGISEYFKSIEGSPTPKTELVKNLLVKFKYDLSETMLIGDSINDYHAAKINGIAFFGYNNTALKETKSNYIESFN
ncbi:MAG TPA: HAD hydrolase-like protein [Salinimicrobium sp.]|nr:HAD hydrolase-like protein [Salinimicrobium sp.]